MSINLSDQSYRRKIGDDLVLRWSTAADSEQILKLYGHVFRDSAEQPEQQWLLMWTRDMLSGKHPLIDPTDFAVVEDVATGTLVAATCLLRQRWAYDGIEFPVGRPEVVATMPDYRNRGLIRAIFELIHARSAAEGHLAQCITGIPYYYRQLGYGYALELHGSRTLPFSAVPGIKPDTPEPFTLRDATSEDLPFVLRCYDRERRGGQVSTVISADYWQWLIEGNMIPSGMGWWTKVIVDAEQRPVGYLQMKSVNWGPSVVVTGLMVDEGVSLAAVLPSVLRGLQAQQERLIRDPSDTKPLSGIGFVVHSGHPVYTLFGQGATQSRPYAWYVRVPDLPEFLRQIAPVLERRLAESALSGHSGDLKLNFYRDALRIRFEQGRLVEAERWQVPVWDKGEDGGFPPGVFLELLFGRRSLADLKYAYPDVWVSDQADALLNVLFPVRPSWVLPLN